jgi:hypothetical protein
MNAGFPDFSIVSLLKAWATDKTIKERMRQASKLGMYTLNRGQVHPGRNPSHEKPIPEHDRHTPLSFLNSEKDLDFRHHLYSFIVEATSLEERNELKASMLRAMSECHSIVLAIDNAKEKAGEK